MSPARILIVEDEKLIRWSVQARLKEDNYVVLEAESVADAVRTLDEQEVDLILLDQRLPDATGLELLERVRRSKPEICVVMMTAYGTVDNAVHAMKLGAFDFLTKPVNLDQLALVVQKGLETTQLRREVHRLRHERSQTRGSIELIGKSPAMLDLIEQIDKIRTSQASTVLLEGESGTGKDLVAKALHYGSPRGDKPFVNITCSALTETLLESELFGHERGAFTDAKSQKKGLLETADGGTAFLDEIGEMGLAMQAKLLRFLEEKTFKHVGGTRDIRVDVRIVAASNRLLREAVAEGRFRADLFYRLEVIPLRLPPLRERREDVPLLAQHFLDHFNREFRKKTTEIEPAALDRLTAHDWPGNIRELRNVIERIMILEDKPRIELADLPASIRGGVDGSADPAAHRELPLGRMTLEELERQAIVQALRRSSDNQVHAAKLLGISRDTLRYRMKKFGLREGDGAD
jgi:DNA-binding NtrC family response regulator